jgi:hypothetical protein
MKKPRVNSEAYYKYMEEFIERAEKVLPIKIYGFGGYSTLSYYWVYSDGNPDVNPNTIPFEILEKLISG